MATSPVIPSIPFMTAAPLPPAAEPWKADQQARLMQLNLIELVSEQRLAANSPAYDYQREVYSQGLLGGLPSVAAQLGVLSLSTHGELQIQGLVKIARILLVNWVLNAPEYARLKTPQPLPALDPALVAYLASIAL